MVDVQAIEIVSTNAFHDVALVGAYDASGSRADLEAAIALLRLQPLEASFKATDVSPCDAAIPVP